MLHSGTECNKGTRWGTFVLLGEQDYYDASNILT